MPSPRVFLCPPAFDWIFENLNKGSFFQLLKSRTTYQSLKNLIVRGGFQLTEKTVVQRRDFLRNNLQLLNDRGKCVVAAICDTQGPWTMVHEIVSVLNEERLRDDWQNMIRAADKPGILVLAFYMFPDSCWQHRLGCRLLKTPSIWKAENKPDEQSNGYFRKMLQGMETLYGMNGESIAAERNAASDAAVDKTFRDMLDKEYKRGRAEQEKKTAEDKREREQKLKETVRQLQEAQKEAECLKGRLRDCERQAAEAEEKLRKKLVEKHEADVDELLRRHFLMDHVMEYSAVTARTETERIIGKLSQTTQAQLAMNQKNGSRRLLREQRKALHGAIDELKAAAEDSVVTMKNIPALLREAEQQLRKIESLLQGETVQSTAFTQIASYIDSIKLDKEAPALFKRAEEFIHEAEEYEILHADEPELLQKHLMRKLAILNDAQLKPHLARSLAAMPSQNGPAPLREFWNLAADLPRLSQVTLVIDGCNALLRNPLWKKMAEDHTYEQATRHFIETIKSKRTCFAAIELVFDGVNTLTTRESVAQNVTVTYASRTEEAHNADNFIISQVMNLKQAKMAEEVWVVTDDYGLREQLEDLCDAFVPAFAIPRFFMA